MKKYYDLSEAAQEFLSEARQFSDGAWGVPYIDLASEPSDEVWREMFKSGWLASRDGVNPVRRGHGYMSEECSRMLTKRASREIDAMVEDGRWSDSWCWAVRTRPWKKSIDAEPSEADDLRQRRGLPRWWPKC